MTYEGYQKVMDIVELKPYTGHAEGILI